MIAVGAFSFLVGLLVGAIGLARLWSWRTSKPEVAKEMLKAMYRQAHPHWLQVSKEDPTRVCPCCGWSETEGLASDHEKRTQNETPAP